MSTYDVKVCDPRPLGTDTCELCGHEQPETRRYSGFTCQRCGQLHAYDETTSMVLTDEQLALLRAAKGIAP